MRISLKSFARPARGTALALIIACVALAACGNKNKRPDGDLVSDKDPVRGFLATIPSDTPYAFVAIEPMPVGPMLSWIQGWTKSVEGMLPNIEETLNDEYVAPETKLVYAVVSEMSGNYSVEGFKKLGLSTSPRFALYGIGFLPALRMDLDDPDAFRAFVKRVETKSGFTSQPETLGKTDFWTYKMGSDFIVMSVVNRQLVWGWTDSAAAELYTGYLLGEQLPAKSMADDNRISPIAQKHGFQKYGAGFIDLGRVAQILFEPGNSLNDQVQALLTSGEREPVSPECLSETKHFIEQMPRVVLGYEEWTGTRARLGMGLEVTTDIGKRLAEAKTSAPLINSDLATSAPFAAGFGFDVGKVLDIVNAQLMAVQQSPYQCSWYSELNGMANEVTMYSALVPALVTNLRGGGVVVQNVRPVTATAAPALPPDGSLNPDPGPSFKVEGIAVVNSTAPSALLSWLRTLAPEFMNVTPDPGGIPMALPPSEMLATLEDPHVVLTATSLALTSGSGIADEAARLVLATPTDAPFFSIAYDLKKAWAMFGEAEGSTNAMMQNMALGRTEISLEPRDGALFMHFDMAIAGPTTTP